eukprot:748704-Hanusia_phi.AAC.2
MLLIPREESVEEGPSGQVELAEEEKFEILEIQRMTVDNDRVLSTLSVRAVKAPGRKPRLSSAPQPSLLVPR